MDRIKTSQVKYPLPPESMKYSNPETDNHRLRDPFQSDARRRPVNDGVARRVCPPEGSWRDQSPIRSAAAARGCASASDDATFTWQKLDVARRANISLPDEAQAPDAASSDFHWQRKANQKNTFGAILPLSL